MLSLIDSLIGIFDNGIVNHGSFCLKDPKVISMIFDMETWNLPGPGEHNIDFFLPEGHKVWPMDTPERERELKASILGAKMTGR